MRDMVWNAVRSKVPEGMILPWWALAVRAVMYPLDFFYWRMSKATGYQWQNDTWLIEGVTYSGSALRWLSEAQGETCRVTRTGKTVTVEIVHNALGQEPCAAVCARSSAPTGCASRDNNGELKCNTEPACTSTACKTTCASAACPTK